MRPSDADAADAHAGELRGFLRGTGSMQRRSLLLELAVGFGLLGLVMAAVGWFGVARTSTLTTEEEALVKARWQLIELSREALSYSTANNRLTMEIFLLRTREEIDPVLAERAANSVHISTLLK